MANIVSSSSWDRNLAKSSGQEGSTETASSSAIVPDYEQGRYVLLAQKHFNIDDNDRLVTRTTSRFVIVNTNKQYARTICISHLTKEIWYIGNDYPELEEYCVHEVKDPKGGDVIVRRIKKEFIPKQMYKLPNRGYLPLNFSNGIFTIEKDVYLEMKGYVDGVAPAYEFKCTTPDGHKHYDVAVDRDGYVVFDKLSVPSYDVLLEPVSPIERQRAIKIIEGNPAIRELFSPLRK